MKLLLRLYDVSEGTIQINKKSIKEYSIQRLREKIGVVFQQNYVYAISLMENMEFYQKIDKKTALETIDLLKMKK